MSEFNKVMTSWFIDLQDDVLLLAGALIIAIIAFLSAYRIVRSMTGSLYRLGFLLASAAYLVIALLFISPPNISAPERGIALVTAGAVTSELSDFDGDLFFTDAMTWDADIRQFMSARANDRERRTGLVSAASDLSQLSGSNAVTVFGAGMQRADWFEQIEPLSIQVSAQSMPDGFRRLRAPEVIQPGEALIVDVEVMVTDRPSRRIDVLDASGDTVVSSRIDSTGRISLKIDALPVGQHVFRAVIVDEESGTTVGEELVAVLVRQPVLARALVLQSAPSFESRFMVRWLEQSGAQVALRNQVSKARYVQRFINREAVDLTNITPALLASVDVIVIDGRAFESLSDPERAALLNADNGHGVLVTLGDRDDTAGFKSLSPTLLNTRSDTLVDYRLSDVHTNEQTLLQRLDSALDLGSVVPLVQSSDGSVVAGKLKGAQHITVSLIADSYRMVGRGDRSDYTRLWSFIINQAARPVSNNAPRSMAETLFVGQRSRWCVFAGGQTMTLQVADPDGQVHPLSTFADRFVPSVHCGWFWPRSSGWLTVRQGESHTQVFVYPRTARALERAINARSATQSVANASLAAARGRGSPDVREPMSRRWLLVALLLSALLSWGLQRLGQPR